MPDGASRPTTRFRLLLEGLEDRTAPATLQGAMPDDAASAAIRARVAADYPAVNSPSTSDFTKTNLIRQWAYANSDFSDEAHLLTTDNRVLSDALADFDNDRGGVWCGGAAWFLMKLYEVFGFRSGRVGTGLAGSASGFTHVVTLVRIDDRGVAKTVVQDAYENYTLADRQDSPLDVQQLLSYLEQNLDVEVVIKDGPPLERDQLRSTAAMERMQSRPASNYALHWPDGLARPFQYVRPDTWKTRSAMSNSSVEAEYYQPLCRGGFLGDGHRDKSIYAFLYRIWADGDLGREFLDRYGTTDKVMPPFRWSGGLNTPTAIDTRTPFILERSFQVLPNSDPFSLEYYTSLDDIFGNNDDLFLGREVITQTANGAYTGTSPQLVAGRPGQQHLLVVRRSLDPASKEVPTATLGNPITVTGPTEVTLDDGHLNHKTRGDWRRLARSDRFRGDAAHARPGDGSAAATWYVRGLPPGEYQVQVTWSAGANRATDAPYRVYDGQRLLATVRVDQSVPPRPDAAVGPVAFQTLGRFPIGGGRFRVVLGNDAEGVVVADAVRVNSVTDLSGVRLGIAPDQTFAVGVPFSLTYEYCIGGVAPPTPVTVAYYASGDDVIGGPDDVPLGSETLASATELLPGEHSRTSPDLRLDVPGDYHLYAVADPDDRIAEGDETNNVAQLAGAIHVG